MMQIGARVLGARKAEPVTTSGTLFTVLEGTGAAGVCFVAVASSASGTGVPVSNKCAAQAAVQAARRNQLGATQRSWIGAHDYRLMA